MDRHEGSDLDRRKHCPIFQAFKSVLRVFYVFAVGWNILTRLITKPTIHHKGTKITKAAQRTVFLLFTFGYVLYTQLKSSSLCVLRVLCVFMVGFCFVASGQERYKVGGREKHYDRMGR